MKGTYFDLVVSLKLTTAAVLTSVFLHHRLNHGNSHSLLRRIALVFLSVAYALGQYSIAQASNLPWLDGVYMLPLILLGVYRLVRQKKGLLLSIAVACSVLFNWYTGGINCLFAILWFLFETVLLIAETRTTFRKSSLTFLTSALRFCIWMLIGVMLSGILFLPTIGAMRKSTRGSLDFSMLKNKTFIGNLLTSIEAYVPGSMSSLGTVSLYAGSLPVLGCIGFFLCRKIKKMRKGIYAFLLLTVLLLFYWNPFYALFSLFKDVHSYWYRFSYVGILTLVFIAADFFLLAEKEDIRSRVPLAAAAYSLLILIFNELKGTPNLEVAYRSIFLVIVCTLGILISIRLIAETSSVRVSRKLVVCALMGILFLTETGYGVSKQMDNYHTDDVSDYRTYVANEQQQIDEIKGSDSSLYRISQTSTRRNNSSGLTANYQEAMAFHYWSIAGYTSSPDTVQLTFFNKSGYRQNGENFCIVNTSILGTDSLLSVKYVLSAYPINGLTLRNDLGEQNGKSVYENPYALPMAFTYSRNEIGSQNTGSMNSFEYQNALFSQLSGKAADLYTPLNYTVSSRSDGSLCYQVKTPLKGNYAVYGNLPWDQEYDGTVNVNDIYQTRYARWASPSVFYIPLQDQNSSSCTVTVTAGSPLSSNGKEQFYALDLNKLAEITASLQKNAASVIDIRNGRVHVEAEASGSDQRLFLSVPYDKSWSITCNGKEVEPELIGDCLYSIPLENGNNTIEMIYHVDYQTAGFICTLAGLLLLILYEAIRCHRRKPEQI